jgi:molybdopterin synthase sulfur carrier subunit
MKIKIKYFGMLVEKVNMEEEIITFSGETISDLIETLTEAYSELSTCEFQIAQNQSIVTPSEKVTGAEIALLPPFSGG